MAKIIYSKKILNKKNIPILPVPTLEETSKKIFEWLMPFFKINNFDLEELKEELNKFIASQDIKEAQKFLLNKSKNKNSSYLIDWWLDSYLDFQNLNLMIGAGVCWGNEKTNNMDIFRRAAFIIWSVSNFYLDYKNNSEKYEFFQTPKFKISLDQLNGLLASYRIMDLNSDKYIINDDLSTNVIIAYKNSFYNLEIIKNNKIESIDSIELTLKKIVENHKIENKTKINYIELSKDRNKDYFFQKTILNKNKINFLKIQKSIFVLCLDTNEKQNEFEIIKQTYNGDTKKILNRWFCKSLNIGVNKSIHCPITMEHTYFDGASLLFLLNYIDKKLKNLENQYFLNKKVLEFELLNFNLKQQEINYLDDIFLKYKKQSNNCVFSHFVIDFGKDKLKELGIKSVDGFFQLIGQLAQKKVFDTFFSTYESVDVRCFFKGRTECLRPLTNEIIIFSNKYFNNELNNKKELKIYLEKVENAHYKKIKDCKNGRGITRHLLGLKLSHKQLNKRNKLPMIDIDFYNLFISNKMSTSNMSYKTLTSFMFWPVQKNGYTIAYAIKKDKIFAFLTSWTPYKNNLLNYSKTMKNIFVDIFNKLKV